MPSTLLVSLSKLPRGESDLEWLASNTMHFQNQVNMLYGAVFTRCTDQTCAKMNAGPRFDYLWADGKDYKKPTAVSARKYVELLMKWTSDQLEDPAIFPIIPGEPFPPSFLGIVKNIFKRLFRVYAHIYHCHFAEVIAMGIEGHLHTSFKHFMFFVKEFSLVEDADLMPMKELIAKMDDELKSGSK